MAQVHNHIAHLKRHRNILYSIVLVLLIIQIGSFFILAIKVSQIQAQEQKFSHDLQGALDSVKQDTQSNVNSLARELSRQREYFQQAITNQTTNFEKQIDILKVSQDDFSSVINQDIKGVVTISTDKATASGFIVNSAGYIVTNAHVIEGGSFVKVQTYNGFTYDARVIGEDTEKDVALLKVDGVFDHVDLGNSDDVQPGEKVIAIGNPLGLSFTVTEGIVSAIHRQGPNGLAAYIQTDVTLNPGNSGGPLIDKEGKVIGMNNFKIGGAEGLGFALESNIIKDTINSFVNGTMITE